MTLHAFTFALTLFGTQSDQPLSRHVYPLTKRPPSPEIAIDVSDSPESEVWGKAAKGLLEEWYPTLCSFLATDKFESPKKVTLKFRKEMGAPAWASGDEISINAKWIKDHPDDLGMVIHEMVHVIQKYPRNEIDAGWLVEGIADYIRWWRYEPEAPRPKIDPEKSSYKNGYRVTGAFLAWASRKYDMRLVPSLDAALRTGKTPLPVFVKMTGKDVDTLWKEFADTYRQP